MSNSALASFSFNLHSFPLYFRIIVVISYFPLDDYLVEHFAQLLNEHLDKHLDEHIDLAIHIRVSRKNNFSIFL